MGPADHIGNPSGSLAYRSRHGTSASNWGQCVRMSRAEASIVNELRGGLRREPPPDGPRRSE
eukprot:3033345-Pyramimonas_sp.AAC.1